MNIVRSESEFAARSEEQETSQAPTSRKELSNLADDELREEEIDESEELCDEDQKSEEVQEDDFFECENEWDVSEAAQNVLSQPDDLGQATNIINGFERLILRRRQELAAELRGLQFYFRPVAQVTDQLRIQLEQAQSRNQPLTRSVQSPHLRSEQVQSEINALRSSERVRAFLHSNVRRDLDSILTAQSTRIASQQPSANRTPASQPVVNQTFNHSIPEQSRNINVNSWLAQNQNFLQELTREQILTELNGLVNAQPVANLLNSQFRESLENHLENALRRTGSNGLQTRRVIQQLANNIRSRRVQINEVDNNSDSASAINETRTRYPTLHNSREIKELKNEMKELKSMLKLTFELQLDMQRSLKQEISALISNTLQNGHSSSLISSTRPSAEGMCIICSETQVDTVLYQCGHMCTCYACSMILKDKALNCPVCRAVIKDIVRAYRSAL